jgi:hypothetical protein
MAMALWPWAVNSSATAHHPAPSNASRREPAGPRGVDGKANLAKSESGAFE